MLNLIKIELIFFLKKNIFLKNQNRKKFFHINFLNIEMRKVSKFLKRDCVFFLFYDEREL